MLAIDDSVVYCTFCGKRRHCSAHQRAEHPPSAAERWLKGKCDRPAGACRIRYRAGIAFGGPLTGQDVSNG